MTSDPLRFVFGRNLQKARTKFRAFSFVTIAPSNLLALTNPVLLFSGSW
jgi:hypothetical protein